MVKKEAQIRKNSPSLNWFKNVAKSLGYTSTELVQSLTPSIRDFITSNADFAKEMVDDIKSLKSDQGNKFADLFKGNQQFDIARTALKNAIEDIKSGKIYNKERHEANFEDEFSLDDFSFDDSMEVEVEKPSGKSEAPVIKIKNIQPPINANNPLVKAMQKQSESTLKAAQITNEVNMNIASNQMALNRRIGSATLQGLQSINENLALLVNFHSESMSKYVAASLKYYEDSLNTLNKTLEELKRSNGDLSQNNVISKMRDSQDIFLAYGGLDMRSYMDHIKKNLKENPFLNEFKMMYEDTDTLKMLAASPLSFISTKIVTAIIPQFLQSTMANLDKTFSAFFPALMMKINRLTTSFNPILQLIGEIFGVKTTTKSSVDLSRYNRGQIPFDGETKKAIVEVIPTYLRKILSALNGQEEIAFDYDKGQFRTVSSMKEEFERLRNNKALSAYSEAIEDIKRRSKAFVFKYEKDREEFSKGIEKFFTELTRRNHLVNPNLVIDKNGNVRDELSEVFDFGDRGKLNLFRQLILTMPKSEQMRLFGQNVLEARRLVKEMMEEAEENPTRYNANVIFNNAGFDEHLITKNGRKEVKKGYGLFNPVDKFNYTSLDYLRDIKMILLEGIKVFPLTSLSGGLSPSDDGLNNVLAEQEKRRRKMLEDQERLVIAELSSSLYRVTEYTPEQIRKLAEKGRRVLDSSLDLYDLSDQDIANQLHLFDSLNNESEEKEGQKKTLAQWVGKFIRGDKQQKFNLMREQIDRIVQKPVQLLKAVFDKIDNTLYTVVFGSTDKGDQPSFMDRTMAALREKLDKLTFWVKENVFEPVKEFFVGENGIVNKFKQSDFYKDLVEKSKKVADILFGKQGPDGKRRDGLLSDVGNNILDTFDSVKYYFTGKAYVNRAGERFEDNPNSVFGEVKTIFNNFKTDIKHYLFGKKDAKDPEQQKGALTGVLNMFKEGVHNFKEAIFGPSSVKTSAKMTMEELKETIKQRAPKALAWGTIGAGVGTVTALSGGMGLLGSLFLPGGPIGAAIVGTTLGFLSQSDRFKDWLFGEKDARGERIGGIISKSTQDFLRKHRTGIIGGATFGAIHSLLPFGILPSFFLPGGPIAGAIFGIGTQMILRSEGFQRAIFGEKGADGKRYGGLLGKVFSNKHDKNPEVRKYLANMGVGALGGAGLAAIIGKFGLLGAMLTPFGPVGGAIAGLAAGIAVSTDKWKKALFGEWDEETGLRKGGLLGKFNNWFKLEVVEPMKLKFEETSLALREWFTKSMAIPFQRAINPIKQEFKYMTDTLTEWFKKGWDSFRTKIGQVFEEHVGKPFGKFMQENVMKPLKGFLSKIIGGIAKIFRPIVEAPVKVVSAIGESFRERQERRGLKKHIEDGWKDIVDYRGRRERGERMGLFRTVDKDGNVIGKGLFGRIGDMHFSKEARDNARYGEHGASYARQDDEKFAKILSEKQGEFDKKRAEIEEKRRKLQMRRELGLKYDYDNFDEQGRNISRIYNITKSTSAFKRFVTNQGQQGANQYNQSIQELTGLSVSQILGRREEDVDVSRLSRNERKRISKAIKSGLKGNALMKFLGIEGIEDVTTTPEQPATSEDIKESTHETTEVFKTSIETMTEKVTEALKESSSKSEIKETIVPKIQESNNYLATIASKIGEVIGQKSRVFKAKKLGSKATSIPNIQGGQQSVRNQIDVEGTLDERDEQIQSEFEVHHEKIKKRYGHGKLDKDSLLMRIATDVRIIASEVKGQLDGVGSNVYKIRKTLQNFLGISDDSIQGSANRDRVGFFGKIRRALYRPFDFIKDQFMKGIIFVTEKITAFGQGIKNVTKAIIKVPVDIAKGIWGFTKEIGSILKSATLEFIKLPGRFLKVIGKGLEAAVETIKIIGPSIAESLKGVASMFSGFLGMVGETMKGFGKGVGNVLKEVGKATGEFITLLGKTSFTILETVTNTLGQALKMTTKFLFNAAENIVDFTFKMAGTVSGFLLDSVKFLGDQLVTVGKSLVSVITSPFKFLGEKLGVFKSEPKEVIIAGGYLDNVKEVTVIKEIEDCVCVSPNKNSIQKVYIVGKEDERYESPNKFLQNSGVHKVLSNSLVDALEKFDDSNDKEESNKLLQVNRKKKMDEKREYVSRKNANYLLDQLKNKEEKDFLKNSTERQLKLLEGILNSNEEHRKEWSFIFGKRGLITLALLFLLPKLLKYMMGIGNSNRTLDDGTVITNSDFMEHAAKGVATGSKHLVNKKLLPAAKTLGEEAKAVGKIVESGKTFIDDVVSPKVVKAVEAAKNSKLGQKISSIKNTQFGQKVRDASDVMVKKAEEAVKIMRDTIDKMFTHPSVQKIIGKATSSKTVVEMLSLFDKVFTKEFVRRNAKRITSAMTKALVKTGSIAFTLGASEVVWGAWNITTGYVEAARLFKVRAEDVDTKMRIISSAFKTIIGFGFNFIIGIINDILVETIGVDFIQYAANYMYNVMSDEEDYKSLLQKQSNFKSDWEKFNEGKKNKISLDAYNDLVNKSVAQKIVDGTKNVFGTTKKFLGKAWDTTKDARKTVGKSISSVASKAWDGTKKVAGYVGDAAGKVASKTWEVTKNVGTAIGKGAVSLGKKAADSLGLTDNSVKRNFNLKGDGKISLGMRASNIVAEGLEKMSFGMLNSDKTVEYIYGIGLLVNDYFTNIEKAIRERMLDPVGDFIGRIAGEISEAFTTARKTISKRLKNIGKTIENRWDNITTFIRDGFTSAEKTISKWLKNITGTISKAWEDISTFVSTPIKETVETTRKTWTTITKPIDDAWTTIRKTISDGLTNLTKGVEDLFSTITSPFKNIGEFIKERVKEQLKNFGWEVDDNKKKKEGKGGPDDKDNNFGEGVEWASGSSRRSRLVGKAVKYAAKGTKIYNKYIKPNQELLGKVADRGSLAFDPVVTMVTYKNKKKAAYVASATLAGDMIGGRIGGAIGAALGTFAGPVGTAVGSVAGSIVGGYIGSKVGKIAGETAYKWTNKKKNKKSMIAHNTKKWGAGNLELHNGAVYYSQDDPRWTNKDFTSTNSKGKKSKFKKAGCGPTSAAMIVSTLTGRQVDPMQAYEFANRNGYTDPELGTRSDFFKDFASVHGVEINERKGKEGIIEQLKQRKMVILRGEGSGPFTKSGHYVVATGITKDGKILINDPLNKKRSKAYSPSVINKVTSHYVAKSPSMFDTQNKMFGFTEYGSGNVSIKDIYGNARITSDYGYRSDPFTGTRKMHRGIDLVYGYGKPIKSFTNGTVVYSGWGRPGTGYNNYGKVVAIKDEYGKTHVYAHLSNISVGLGSKVKAGTVIGHEGSTGRSTGSHLHYEIRRSGYGTDVNPTAYLKGYKGDPNFKPELIASGDSSGSDASIQIGSMMTPSLLGGLPEFMPESLNVFNKIPSLAEQYLTNFYMGKKGWSFVDPDAESGSVLDDGSISISYTDTTIKGFKDSKPFKGPYANIINKYAQKYNLEPQLIAAIIRKESNFNPGAVSDAGARGLMQLMPATARSLGVRDPFDPEQNIAGGTKYIRQQINSFKDLALALAAYNAGPGNVKKYGGIPPFSETRNYVNSVIGYLEYYRNQTNSGKGGVGGGFEPAFERKENLQVENVDNNTGSGEITKSVANRLELARVQSTRIPERISSEYTRPQFYDSRQFNGEVSENDLKLLKDVIDLLKDIANNTKTTYQGIDKLASQQENRGNVQQNIIVPNNQPQPSTTIINGGQNYQQQAKYSIAKTIAGGRI